MDSLTIPVYNRNTDYYTQVYNSNDNDGSASSKNLNALIESFRPSRPLGFGLAEEAENASRGGVPSASVSSNQNSNETIKKLAFATTASSMKPTSPRKSTTETPPPSALKNKQEQTAYGGESAPNDYIKKLISSVNFGGEDLLAQKSTPTNTAPPATSNRTIKVGGEQFNQTNPLNLNQSGIQLANNENNLIEEYEQELKRRDTNMLEFNATSSLNFNQMLNTNDFNLAEEQMHGGTKMTAAANQLNSWSSSQSMKNLEQPPKASSTKNETNMQNQLNNHRIETNVQAATFNSNDERNNNKTE
jgi:hypothetical protein